MWFLERAAAQNDVFSLLTLGYLYFTGYGTSADPQKAAGFFQQAARLGEPVPAVLQDAKTLASVQPVRAYSAKRDHIARVKRAQAGLKALGYYKGIVDGIDGPGTQRAVTQFQKDRQIEQTGAIDVVLMRHLYARIYHDPMKRHLQ